MKGHFGLLGAEAPVLLEPALRWSRRAGVGEGRGPLHEFAGRRILLTFSATTALYQAARALVLDDRDTVLIPSYNCGHEIEPMLRAGLRVRFYRVRRDLSLDLDDLVAGIDDSTRAVLVTHYFGFPQELAAVRAVCDDRKLALIEDCAHALFSRDGGELLGAAGDLAVFSLRKSLPLPHGGALLWRDPALQLPSELPRPPRLSTWAKVLERYQKGWLMPKEARPGLDARAAFLANRLLVDAARCLRAAAHACGRVQFDPDDESFAFPPEPLGWGVARSVERSLASVSWGEIVEARRRNFGVVLAAGSRFVGCRPLFRTLPAGVCPLYFPVFAADPWKLIGKLRRAGISAVQWWSIEHEAVPWHAYPEAAELKRSVVALPVHQDLGEVHMRKIVNVLSGGE